MYYAEVRRMLNRYPDLKKRKWTDFVSGHYRQALSTWEALLLKYPNTDVAAAAAQKIARRLLQLGHTIGISAPVVGVILTLALSRSKPRRRKAPLLCGQTGKAAQ